MPANSFTPQTSSEAQIIEAGQPADSAAQSSSGPVAPASGTAEVKDHTSLTRFLLERARLARKTTAALGFAKGLSGAIASAVHAANPSEHVARAARIGEAVGSRCAEVLTERGGVPDWMSASTLKARISSLMWPAASEGLRLGKDPDALAESLADVFLSLVDNIPVDLEDPPYARLPEGIAVALSEQKQMAEKIIPQILALESDKNCRFYLANSKEFTSWIFQKIRESTKELSAIIGSDTLHSEQNVIIYQSMFGSTAALAGAALRLAAQQVFTEIKAGLAAGKKPRQSETQQNFARVVRSHLDDGVSILRNVLSRRQPSAAESTEPEMAGDIVA